MNGPTTIYRLKPVFEIPQKLELPKCMYMMKNPVACVTNTSDHTDDEKEVLASIMDKVKDILKIPLPELASLEVRWDSILKQLEELKLQMAEIRKTVTENCNLSGCPILDSKTLDNLKTFQGAVINANPHSPPYSLLLLKYLYKSTLPIIFSSHTHSTLPSLPDNVKCFSEPTFETNNALKLHLIWKNDIQDTELVINPVKQLPIRGEVNILRLFGKFGLQALGYPSEELIQTLYTDLILDLCHRLLHVTTSKEKASIYKNLNAKLGRNSYFGGEKLNISDISVWSALKQINVNPSQDLSPNLAKWYLEVDKILFQ